MQIHDHETVSETKSLGLLLKRSLSLVLILTHLSYVWPQGVYANETGRQIRVPDLSLMIPPLNGVLSPLPRSKGEIEIPEGIEASTEVVYEVEIAGPQSAELTIPSDVQGQLNRLSPIEQQAALEMFGETSEESFEAYRGYFAGQTPQRLHVQFIQHIGQDLAIDETYMQMRVVGYGPRNDPVGEVTFRLAPLLVTSGGDDPTSRDYESHQESQRRGEEFFNRWMQTLREGIFDVRQWVSFEYNQYGIPIRMMSGLMARRLVQEATLYILSRIAEVEGVGPGANPMGLLPIFNSLAQTKAQAKNNQLECFAWTALVQAITTVITKLVIWVIVEGVKAFFYSFLIYPLSGFFVSIVQMSMAIDAATRTIAAVMLAEFTIAREKKYASEVLDSIQYRGQLLEGDIQILRQLNKKHSEMWTKLGLRIRRIYGFLNSTTMWALGWGLSLITGMVSTWSLWQECRNKETAQIRGRALAMMQLFMGRDGNWTQLTEYVAASDVDYVKTIRFDSVADMEPYLTADRRGIGMRAVYNLDMGFHEDVYANTIESPRDQALWAGRYVVDSGGREGYGVTTSGTGQLKFLLNESPVTHQLVSDVLTSPWLISISMDVLYPSTQVVCPVAAQTGRDTFVCELRVVSMRNWGSDPEAPAPRVILRIEGPTVPG